MTELKNIGLYNRLYGNAESFCRYGKGFIGVSASAWLAFNEHPYLAAAGFVYIVLDAIQNASLREMTKVLYNSIEESKNNKENNPNLETIIEP